MGFMYMARINGINLYKHAISRAYLNLDDSGQCFKYRNSRFEKAHSAAELTLISHQAFALTKHSCVQRSHSESIWPGCATNLSGHCKHRLRLGSPKAIECERTRSSGASRLHGENPTTKHKSCRAQPNGFAGW